MYEMAVNSDVGIMGLGLALSLIRGLHGLLKEGVYFIYDALSGTVKPLFKIRYNLDCIIFIK